MNNRDALREYANKGLDFGVEEAMCYLLQTYWDEYGTKACEQARAGYNVGSRMPFNPVTFVKKFMKEETLLNTDILDVVAERQSEEAVTFDTDVEIEEGSWREIGVEEDTVAESLVVEGTRGYVYMECFTDAKVEMLNDERTVRVTFSDGTYRDFDRNWWLSPSKV